MRILTVNAGSSSLKAALYELDRHERLVCFFEADRIGHSNGRIRITEGARGLLERQAPAENHDAALRVFIDWSRTHHAIGTPHAIGHRIVHGGRAHREPQRLTPDVLADLHPLAALDPAHLPQALELIATASDRYPEIPQVVCFDTAFHRSMPTVAQLYPLPRQFAERDIIRYGFHGLSCESIMETLQAIDPDAAHARIIIAHLGNGASLTAVRDGVSVDTTMGFTPTGGIMMGKRSGELGNGVLVRLLT